MEYNRNKQAAQWYYSTLFREEAILPRPQAPEEPVPSLIRTARSLENGMDARFQSREAIFIKQAKILEQYEDDRTQELPVTRYFPTYQSLTDPELRWYFSWRARVRRGDVQKTSLSYAFIYIYELINQIGVTDPMDGYEKLLQFRTAYGQLDEGVLPYLNRWIGDYPVYYELDPALLEQTPQVRFDRQVAVLADLEQHSDAQIVEAVKALTSGWLERSRFYGSHRQEMDRVLCRVLKRVSQYYASRCKRTMTEQYFGILEEFPVRLFDAAVFYDRKKDRDCVYEVDPVRVYRCRAGHWSVRRYCGPERASTRLRDLIKTVDAVMRELYADKHPIKSPLETKWLLKIIREEVQALLQEKKEAEARRVTIDYSQLARIRRDASITQEKLTVDEETEEEEPEVPVLAPEPATQTPADSPLEAQEYRLLQCLLYGRPLDWLRAEGCLPSVLADSINEKLFDIFADSVLTVEDRPELIEDYTEELKEMIHP